MSDPEVVLLQRPLQLLIKLKSTDVCLEKHVWRRRLLHDPEDVGVVEGQCRLCEGEEDRLRFGT